MSSVKQGSPVKGKPLKKKKEPIYFIAPVVLLFTLLVVWEVGVAVSGISRTILPSPHAIYAEMAKNFSRDIWPQVLFTLRVILTGYAVAIPLGILIAAVCSQFKLLTQALTPMFILLVVTPMITMVPLFMLWMGFDSKVRIIVVILQATPIILLNRSPALKWWKIPRWS